MILRVGLTGGIATGKSTVMRMLRELGCVTADADAIVAELYRPGHAGHAALLANYGTDILRGDGEIDRQKLSDLAFASPSEVKKLNALIHPLVLADDERRMREEETRLAGHDFVYVVEGTLLLEAGGRQRYERIVVVDVAPEVQIRRAIGRGMAPAEVTRRMANQMAREERLRQADYVIDNSGDEAALAERVKQVYHQLLEDLRAKKGPGQTPGASKNN